MNRGKAILILSFYVVSIFGYGTIGLVHFLAHTFKNPFHHHTVHKHSHHHHHGIQDHSVSKLFKAGNAETQQAMKVVKALYFFSYQQSSVALNSLGFNYISQKIFPFSFQLVEVHFPPPSPPPDLV